MDGSPETLWNPIGSDIDDNEKWVDARFPVKSRFTSIIAEDENNILTPSSLLRLLRLHQRVTAINNGTKYNWNELCFREALHCVYGSILDLWSYNETAIKSLTKENILRRINEPALIRADGRPIDIERYLGSITKNASNKIVAAKAFFAFWGLKSDEAYSKQTGFAKDKFAGEWEKNFGLLFKKNKFGFKNVAPLTRSALNNAADTAMQSDVFILSAGYMLMILYASLMLGKFNRLRNKLWLGSVAVGCVILSIMVSCGISSIFGLPYGPLHNILPFLILGIGVDDAFVIANTWETIKRKSKQLMPIPDLAAETMKQAGLSITVTSFTDFIAFAIGATTLLPALRSFCVYCGCAILALYIFACTIFLASLCLDTKRERNNKDAFLCCIKLKNDYTPSTCSERGSILQKVFDYIGDRILGSKWISAGILIFTAALLAISCFAVAQLKQEYQFEWWLPKASSPRKYLATKSKYFPAEGVHTAVYMNDIDYFKEQDKVENLCKRMKNAKYILRSSVLCWYPSLVKWTEAQQATNVTYLDSGKRFRNETEFNLLVHRFISSKHGRFFFPDLLFSKDPKRKRIIASRYRAIHIDVKSSQDEVNAMDEIKKLAKSAPFQTGKAFAFSKEYLYLLWETNKIIKNELFRNLILASIAVFLVTLLLVANLWVAMMIFACVVLSLTNVAGMMHFWGLTIETVTSVCLILSVGLCIDYSAHIGHAFMTSTKPTRHARSAQALSEIGPAVFNGGVSTCVAFLFLAFSNSYGFLTFFKVFFLVVVFGLFHGLVFLPVLLGLIGPKPYHMTDSKHPVQSENEEIADEQTNGKFAGQLLSPYDREDIPETTI
eukprot:gene9125-10098_t